MNLDALVQLFHSLQAFVLSLNHVFGGGTAGSSTVATSTVAGGVGDTVKMILLVVAKVVLWGIDLTRSMLLKLVDFLS